MIAKESATLLRRGIDPDQLKYPEDTAIAYAEFHTPAQVTNKVRSIVAKMEPAEFEVKAAEAAQARRVILTPQPHGMAQILALLPAVEAQTVWLAIDKLARANRERDLVRIVPTPSSSTSPASSTSPSSSTSLSSSDLIENSKFGTSTNHQSVSVGASLPEFIAARIEPLSLDQLRADALANIAERYLSESSDENLAHGRPVTLNLTLDLPTLLGLNENPGILAGYG